MRPPPPWSATMAPVARIRTNLVFSQLAEHRPYGGIVPEIAARAHLDHLDPVIARALAEAGIGFGDLDARRRDRRAGADRRRHRRRHGGQGDRLRARPALRRGQSSRRPRADARGWSTTVEFPFLLLLVSGGHCQLLASKASAATAGSAPPSTTPPARRSTKAPSCWASAIPAGRRSSARRKRGDAQRVSAAAADEGPRRAAIFPSRASRRRCALAVEKRGGALSRSIPSRCRREPASKRSSTALPIAPSTRSSNSATRHPDGKTLVVAGGVAANHGAARAACRALAATSGFAFVAPPLALCTDNGAMIAWAGIERLKRGLIDALDFAPRPRWPLDPGATPAPVPA